MSTKEEIDRAIAQAEAHDWKVEAIILGSRAAAQLLGDCLKLATHPELRFDNQDRNLTSYGGIAVVRSKATVHSRIELLQRYGDNAYIATVRP